MSNNESFNDSMQNYLSIVREAQTLCFLKDYPGAAKKVKEFGKKYNDDLMLSVLVMISSSLPQDDAISLSYAFHRTASGV